MNAILTVLIFGTCLFLMAVGLIFSKKILRKGCSMDPDSCLCKKENKNPSDCENNKPKK